VIARCEVFDSALAQSFVADLYRSLSAPIIDISSTKLLRQIFIVYKGSPSSVVDVNGALKLSMVHWSPDQ